MTAAAPIDAQATPVQPDAEQAMAFFTTLFPEGGLIHMRSVAEPKDGRTQINHHYAFDASFRATLAEFLTYCQLDRRAAYVLPGTVKPGGTGKADVTSLPAVCVDFDKGDPAASLAAAEELLGRATVVVESGGVTEKGAKLHAYWVLKEPATGAQIDEACRLRLALAERFDGDPVFKQPAQVIRIPGSIHLKGHPRLVKLRAVRPSAAYDLGVLSRAVGISPAPVTEDYFDFSNVTPLHQSQVDRVMTAPIRAEGKDDLTRFEGAATAIGHFIRQIREGRMTEDEAWQATRGWNAATLQPPWPEERLRTDFDRLARIDVETHGPLPVPVLQAAQEWARFDRWTADAFRDAPPARPWLVDGVLPLGVPGMIAARGAVGKSFLVADLALRIAAPLPAAAGLDFNAKPLILGGEVAAHGTAVVFFGEDDQLTVHERLSALDPEGRRFAAPDRLRLIPLPSAGGVRPFFRATGRDGFEATAEFAEVRSWLLSLPELRLVVFDPLQAFVAADITAKPEAGQIVCSALAALASETGAAVLVTHHVGKTAKPISSGEELRDAIRGTTALVDGVRWVYGLWEIKTEGRDDAACAAGEAVKANLRTCRRTHHYRRAPSGVLRQIPPVIVPNERAQQLDALERVIIAAAASGAPFKLTGNLGLYANQERLPEPFKSMARDKLERLGKELLNASRIVKAAARGSKAREWLDGPNGDFAAGLGNIAPGAAPLMG